MTEITTCTKCVNGVITNNQKVFPCDCKLGDTAMFTVSGFPHQFTGKEVRECAKQGFVNFGSISVISSSSLQCIAVNKYAGKLEYQYINTSNDYCYVCDWGHEGDVKLTYEVVAS